MAADSPRHFIFFRLQTYGPDPRADGAHRFTAIRTDAGLNPVGAPLELVCRPPADRLPDPAWCAAQGIDPLTAREGLTESEFFQQIDGFMRAEPGAVMVGHGSKKFDDEALRFGLWRNLLDPYLREYAGGNSRFDIEEFTRMSRLRPAEIEWPQYPAAAPLQVDFSLESLLKANNIPLPEGGAADAGSVLAWARLMREKKGNLFSFAMDNHGKAEAASLLEAGKEVLAVVNGRPAWLASLGPAAGTFKSQALMLDLSAGPETVAMLASADEEWLRENHETSQQSGGGFPLHLIKTNSGAVFAPVQIERPARPDGTKLPPVQVVRPADADRLNLEIKNVEESRAMLPGLLANREALARMGRAMRFQAARQPGVDPDISLYDGFIADHDRATLAALRNMPMAGANPRFSLLDHPRLSEMWLRFRARNHGAEALTTNEQRQWAVHLFKRLMGEDGGESPLEAFAQKAAAAGQDRMAEWARNTLSAAKKLGPAALGAMWDADGPSFKRSGKAGVHDWTVKMAKNPEEGWKVFVDDRHIGNQASLDKGLGFAREIVARLQADGDYRLDGKPPGFLPPPLPEKPAPKADGGQPQPTRDVSVEEVPRMMISGTGDYVNGGKQYCLLSKSSSGTHIINAPHGELSPTINGFFADKEEARKWAEANGYVVNGYVADVSTPKEASASASTDKEAVKDAAGQRPSETAALSGGTPPYMLKVFDDISVYRGEDGMELPRDWEGVAYCHAAKGFVSVRNMDGQRRDIEALTAAGKDYAAALEEFAARFGNAPAKDGAGTPDDFDPATPEGYAKVLADPALQLKFQDKLDALFQLRIVDTRNALRELGWEGDHGAPLTKFADGGVFLQFSNDYLQVGAGANVVGVTAVLKSVEGYGDNVKVGPEIPIPDLLDKTPAEFADWIDAAAARQAEELKTQPTRSVSTDGPKTVHEPQAANPPRPPATLKQVNDELPLLRQFIPEEQLKFIGTLIRGEEGQFFRDRLVDLAGQIKAMPMTYGQDGLGRQAVAHLHYFAGGADWYITEKDAGDPENNDFSQSQAFGMADLGYGPETGYISIEELCECGVELDLHWTPKTLDEIELARERTKNDAGEAAGHSPLAA